MNQSGYVISDFSLTGNVCSCIVEKTIETEYTAFKFNFTNLALEPNPDYDYTLIPTYLNKIDDNKFQMEVTFEFQGMPRPNGYWTLYLMGDGEEYPVSFPVGTKNDDIFSIDSVGIDLVKKYFYIPNIDENGIFSIRACFERYSFVKREAVVVKQLREETSSVILDLEDHPYGEVKELNFLFWSKKSQIFYRQKADIKQLKDNKLTVTLSDFMQDILEYGRRNYFMYLEMNIAGEYVLAGLKSNYIVRNDRKSKFELYEEPIAAGALEEEPMVLVPNYTPKGNFLCFLMVKKHYMYCAQFYEKITKLKLKGSILQLEITTLDRGFHYKKIYVSYRNKLVEKEYPFEFSVKNIGGNSLKITASIDLKTIEFEQFYWDILMTIEKDGEEYDIKMKNKDKWFRRSFYFRDITFEAGNGYIVYPYVTLKNTIALYYREKTEHDNNAFKIRELKALLIYYLFKPYWEHRHIWLVYEKFCVMAQDNGYYFFKYCMENLPEHEKKHIYYIMDKNSPDYEVVKQYGRHIVDFMSLRHCVYLKASKLLITTDTRQHSYAWRSKNSLLKARFQRKKIVFLQHGVIALKQVHNVYRKKGPNRMNMFVTSSEFEKSLILQYFGYKDREVVVTGLSRWDVLQDKSDPSNRMILLMPTWRNWLDEVDDETFMQSDYYKNYMTLLNNEALCEQLKRHNVKLVFYIHPKFKDYISNFEIKNTEVRLIPFGEEPLNELMMQCSMLITDYSSVCWDVYYQEKPVIFYHFDLDMYNLTQGSYIDMEHDLFGDTADTLEELFGLIDYYVTNQFKEKEKYQKMRENLYAHRDHHNCERLYNEIKERGW